MEQELGEGEASLEGLGEGFGREVPVGMRAFVASNGLPEDAYRLRGLYRFVRVNPRLWRQDEGVPSPEEVLRRDLGGVEVEPVSWLRGFYRLPHSASLFDSDAYKTGKIYGIDASSGAAVVALDPRPGDNVLDLCCAPGAKLCMIADMLEGRGTVTGVDIAESRLGACRNVLAKYDIPNARLLLHDGTTVDVLAPPARSAQTGGGDDREKEEEEEDDDYKDGEKGEREAEEDDDGKEVPRNAKSAGGRSRQHNRGTQQRGGNKKREHAELVAARWRKRTKRKRVLPDELPVVFYANPHELCLAAASARLYDKVMIDAQCTLDASVRHILKYGKLGWKDFSPRITQETVDLQKRLLANGFRLLAPGGYLLRGLRQTDVVAWLLEREPAARVVAIPGAERMPCSQGLMTHTLRFYPRDTQTSGLFIARLTKLANDTDQHSTP